MFGGRGYGVAAGGAILRASWWGTARTRATAARARRAVKSAVVYSFQYGEDARKVLPRRVRATTRPSTCSRHATNVRPRQWSACSHNLFLPRRVTRRVG